LRRTWPSACPTTSEAAKKLLAEAGYPNGFEVKMNCPNDRYVNDARNLPGRGRQPGAHRRQDQPGSRDQGHLLPQDPAPRHQFLHAGLDSSTVDAHNVLYPIISTPGDGGRGQFNLGSYSNAKVDELTNARLASETDQKPSATR
jgi:peptide/nickel transport system substrate-binding protein